MSESTHTDDPMAFVQSLIDAFAASDSARYFAHFHPEATFLFYDNPTRIESRKEYEAMWSDWERDAGFRVLDCASTNRRMQSFPLGAAIFTHDVRTTRSLDGAVSVVFERETIVHVRDGESWTCVHEHLSPHPES
jgi:ketosteroid isomerase-like protein